MKKRRRRAVGDAGNLLLLLLLLPWQTDVRTDGLPDIRLELSRLSMPSLASQFMSS